MGLVREKRAEKILEETLMEWLEEGSLPTQDQLIDAYSRAEAIHGDLTRSKLRQVDLPERFSKSSAGEFNELLSGFSSDVDVILRSLMAITELNIVSRGEWTTRANSLQTRIETLKGRIDSLLLMKSEAAGYVAYVDDNFLSLENISSDTTANVDTNTGEVTLGVDRNQAEGAVQGTQVDIKDSHISWTIIESGNIKYVSKVAGTDINNIFSDKKSIWKSEAVTKAPKSFKTASKTSKPVIGELKIQFSSKKEISKITMLMAEATAGSDSVVTCQYSLDGYTWSNVQDESPVFSGTGNFTWRFEKTEMGFLKFIVSKSSPDESTSSGSTYDFGIRQIKVFSEVYEVIEGGVDLYTEVRNPTLAGSPVSFGRIALETCEEVPQGASIRYWVRPHDGVTYNDWVSVSPTNRSSTSPISAVVDFTSPTDEDSDDLITRFDSTLEAGALNLMRTDDGANLSYRFEGPETTISNFYIPNDVSILSDFVLAKNVGYSSGKYPTVSEDLLVGDVQCGWGLEGEATYYCSFYIKNPSGAVLNFGNTQALIDGRTASGSVSVSPGWHLFRTNKANWVSLTGTVPTVVSELKTLDPLYPYNHKYIIEGYEYPGSFNKDSGVYLGADHYCRGLGTRIGIYGLCDEPVSSLSYAIDTLPGATSKTSVFVKVDPSRPSHSNERIRLWYTRRYDSYVGVQLRASLGTEDAKYTPSLSYYRIMFK